MEKIIRKNRKTPESKIKRKQIETKRRNLNRTNIFMKHLKNRRNGKWITEKKQQENDTHAEIHAVHAFYFIMQQPTAPKLVTGK